MNLIYFQSKSDGRYSELAEDTPARHPDGTLCLLKDVRETSDVEVYIGSGWVEGWLPGKPTIFTFQFECV